MKTSEDLKKIVKEKYAEIASTQPRCSCVADLIRKKIIPYSVKVIKHNQVIWKMLTWPWLRIANRTCRN